MKTFLTSKRGKIVAAVITMIIIVLIILMFILSNKGYRTIAVEELNGTTRIFNNGVSTEAYVGLHFKKDDDVTVTDNSDITMVLDADKYVFARENTHFWIEASGKNADTRTTIHLDEGSVLCRIDNKLGADGGFDVETPNATMSVRGTVFRVECYKDASGQKYTVVDVLEGNVNAQVKLENGQNTDESRELKAGESAIVRSDETDSEFVKPEDIEGYKDNDNAFVGDINFGKISQNEALFLGKAIDEGRVLCISKELLYHIVGLLEHDFVTRIDEIPATCMAEGEYYEVCSICGAISEKHVIAKEEHVFEYKNADDEERTCKVCGTKETEANDADEGEKAVNENTADGNTNPAGVQAVNKCASGHTFEKNVVKATCTAEGYEENVCKECGAKEGRTILAALGHKYAVSRQEPTCDSDGIIYHICSNCNDTWTEIIKSAGHNYTTNRVEATCTTDGYEETICSNCGAGSRTNISASGHSEYMNYNVDYHWRTCSKCGTELSSYELHSFDPAGSTGCTVCGRQ